MRNLAATLAIAVMPLAALAACAGPGQQVSANDEASLLDLDEASSVAPEPALSTMPAGQAGLAPRVACYFGDLMVTKSGEPESNQGALLVKLTIDQDRSQMVEETWSFPLYERFVITRAIRGNDFEQRQDDGGFAGSGHLEGEPWIWNRWTASTASPDQSTRVESDTRFENGALVTRERVLDAAGGLQVELRHHLDEIPLDECSKMFAKARTNAASLRAASAPSAAN